MARFLKKSYKTQKLTQMIRILYIVIANSLFAMISAQHSSNGDHGYDNLEVLKISTYKKENLSSFAINNEFSDKKKYSSSLDNLNKSLEKTYEDSVIDVTRNFVGKSNSKTTITSFPNTMPSFTLGSGTTGWTDLNVSTTITVNKTSNTNLVTVEGMSQINNTEKASSFQFAIGIFVDNELKVVRKFNSFSSNSTCVWKKFNVSGVFENLSVGNHSVKVYAYNLPKMSNNYSNITYGGAASNSCDNLNEDMARIFITAQVAETGN